LGQDFQSLNSFYLFITKMQASKDFK